MSCTLGPNLCNGIKKSIKQRWLLAAGFHAFLRPKCHLLMHEFCLGKESGHLGFLRQLSRTEKKKKLKKSSGSQWSWFFLKQQAWVSKVFITVFVSTSCDGTSVLRLFVTLGCHYWVFVPACLVTVCWVFMFILYVQFVGLILPCRTLSNVTCVCLF